MADHPGQVLARLIRTYRPDQTEQIRGIDGPDSHWARLTFPIFAERVVLRYATAPADMLDRAAASVVEHGLRLVAAHGPFVPSEPPAHRLAGRAVGIDAVLRAREHRPDADYRAGQHLIGHVLLGQLLPQLPGPGSRLFDTAIDTLAHALSAVGDAQVRAAADWLAAHVGLLADPAASALATPVQAGPVADMINAELDRRAAASESVVALPVIVPGRGVRTDGGPRVGDAVRIPVPPPPIDRHVWHPMAGPHAFRGVSTTAGPHPPSQAGVVIGVHNDPADVRGEPGTITVAVAGCDTPVQVRADAADPDVPEFPTVVTELGAEAITDPLTAADLLGALYAWAHLDRAEGGRPTTHTTSDHDQLTAVLAKWTGTSPNNVAAGIQGRAPVEQLAHLCRQHPWLRRMSEPVLAGDPTNAVRTARHGIPDGPGLIRDRLIGLRRPPGDPPHRRGPRP